MYTRIPTKTIAERSRLRGAWLKAGAAGAVGSLTVAAGHAQCSPTFAPAAAYLVGGTPVNAAVGDLNADGRLDIVASNEEGFVSVMLNHGDGTFAPAVRYPTAAMTRDVAIHDINGDGVLDLLTANRDDSSISVMLGMGDGTFSPATNLASGASRAEHSDTGVLRPEPARVIAGDFNRDGWPDLAAWNANTATLAVRLAIGHGFFSAPVEYPAVGGTSQEKFYAGMSVCDLTNDGDLDIVVSDPFTPGYTLFAGDGLGGFGSPVTNGFSGPLKMMETGDFNQDGRFDVVTIGNGGSMFRGPGGIYGMATPAWCGVVGDFNGDAIFDVMTDASILLINSHGGVDEVGVLDNVGSRMLTAGDVNGDGRLDIVSVHPDGRIAVSINTTSGTSPTFAEQPVSQSVDGGVVALSASVHFPAGNGSYKWRRNGKFISNTVRISGADTHTLTLNPALPEDVGTYELVAVGECSHAVSDPAVLSLSGMSCPVVFAAPSNRAVGLNPTSTIVADMNSDGFPDLIAANFVSETVSIAIGDGGGDFLPATSYPIGGGPWGVAAGDLNDDGTPDLAIANHTTGHVTVMLSNHLGQLVVQRHFLVDAGPISIVMGDFNADGKHDLATANYVANTISVLLGTGDGHFAPANSYPADASPAGVAASDLDGDGVVDLVVANSAANNVSVLRGTGSGSFVPDTSYSTGAAPHAVSIGDVDSDGYADIVSANFASDTVSILFGAGHGEFAAAVHYAAGVSPRHVSVGDLNGDGRADLVISNYNSNAVSVLVGNGRGAFRETTWAAGINPVCTAVADINLDSRADLVVANANGDNLSILLNHGDSIGFSQQPRDQVVNQGAAATFTVKPIGEGPFAYQWRRNGAPITGATASTLTISSVTPSSLGSYDVQVRGGCNPMSITTSYPALLSLSSCIADTNRDGAVTSQDFFDFLAVFFDGCP